MSNPEKSINDWQKPSDRRKAAEAFLRETLRDDKLRDNALANPAYAREAFQKYGNICCDPDVQIICVDAGLPAQDKLVVLILPEKGTPVDSEIDPLQHWVATWVPYDRDDA